jgi:hypothetical protein
MPKTLTEGDPVRVVDREVLAADTKSQLYYSHYKGLTGTITKIYPDASAVVTVDTESLPTEIRSRHTDGSEKLRKKWLDGLSDEARNKLSASEKKFGLRYTLLVGVSDLAFNENGTPATRAALTEPGAATAVPARKSLADIEAEEAQHLAEIALNEQDNP